MASTLLSAMVQHLQTSARKQGEGSAILQHISTLEVGAGGEAQGWSGAGVELCEHWMLEENWSSYG